MDLRLAEFSNTVWHHKRIGLNYVQPQLIPAVTQVKSTIFSDELLFDDHLCFRSLEAYGLKLFRILILFTISGDPPDLSDLANLAVMPPYRMIRAYNLCLHSLLTNRCLNM